MNGLSAVALTLSYLSVGVGMLSVLVPQKRTRRIMSFVIGIFFIATLLSAVKNQAETLSLDTVQLDEISAPEYSEDDLNALVAQQTADNLTSALNDLLLNEGISVDDIQLTLKISDEGRISVQRAVIYIDESVADRKNDIESIIYRNLSKEPEIYVTGQKAHRAYE